jgi:hypothetical protein
MKLDPFGLWIVRRFILGTALLFGYVLLTTTI